MLACLRNVGGMVCVSESTRRRSFDNTSAGRTQMPCVPKRWKKVRRTTASSPCTRWCMSEPFVIESQRLRTRTACALVQDSKLSQHTCIETTESGESRKVAAFRISLQIDALQTVSHSNRLELPLQAVLDYYFTWLFRSGKPSFHLLSRLSSFPLFLLVRWTLMPTEKMLLCIFNFVKYF